MAELVGTSAVIKVSGTATAFTGEATTEDATQKIYQITDTVKQVLDRTAAISVFKKSAGQAAEAGTDTTTIKLTDHGLAVGDIVVNTTRDNAVRAVLTKPDADTITVTAVTDQTTGDNIDKYPIESSSNYTLNRLNGTVTYAAALTRVIRISGQYLPMSTAAYAHEYRYGRGCDMLLAAKFGDTHKKRLAGLKFGYGTLLQWDMTDSYYSDALVAGEPIVIEIRGSSDIGPQRVWALFDSDELRGAIDGMQDEVVSFISTDALLDL